MVVFHTEPGLADFPLISSSHLNLWRQMAVVSYMLEVPAATQQCQSIERKHKTLVVWFIYPALGS